MKYSFLVGILDTACDLKRVFQDRSCCTWSLIDGAGKGLSIDEIHRDTSLHDGMNLVAKEFVAARDDEHGVLVLSALRVLRRSLRTR